MDSTMRRIRPHGPYGPQSSGGSTRCQITSCHHWRNRHHHDENENVGTPPKQNLTRPASTSRTLYCSSSHLRKNTLPMPGRIGEVHARRARLVRVITPRMKDVSSVRMNVHEPTDSRKLVEQPTDIFRFGLGEGRRAMEYIARWIRRRQRAAGL